MAFMDCPGLTEVTIPNSVNTIGARAFEDCSGIKVLRINDSAESLSLSGSRFSSNVIEALYLGRNINVTNYFSGKTTLKEVTIGNSVTSIGHSAFEDCYSLTSVTIPNSVTSIGEGAFFYCTGLTEVNFNAENCISMGSYHGDAYGYAFYHCANIKILNIGNNVKNIPNFAFIDCYSLTSVTIPNSVNTIGELAFGSCSGLKEITAMGTIPADASETAFGGVDKNMCVLYVPFGCKEVYANAPVWEEFYNIVEKAGIGGVEDIAADGAESVGVADGRLVVNTLSPTPVIVYTMSGSVVFNGHVDGERHIELPRGFYIVRLGAESKKISL